ncbi:Glc operon transcriptional activator [Paraconexibacter sp. AEG42_29]|uniref:Glc operon transcriptional activator n=1 Tax=Paraconexibacter sp. AEG42_29 TaxID=2997339 RepID=A0AAU7APK2_9ACTN
MDFTEVVRRPAYEQVAEQLREAILSGSMPAGSELPSERELTDSFGVARTTVREALRALQAQGLAIADRPTSPLRVARAAELSAGPARDAFVHLLRLGAAPLSDLVELRCALEGAAVGAAARQRRVVLDDARAEVEVMRGITDDVEAFEEADVRFHLALVAASGNEALHLVMLAVREPVGVHLLASLRALGDPVPVLRRLTREHAKIVEAIEAHDGTLAAERVAAHIRGLYKRSLG